MDKIRLDFFDILGYLIPGTALLMALWVTADEEVKELSNLYLFVSKIKVETLLSGVVIAYIFGFTLHFFGSLLNWLLDLKRVPWLWLRKAMSYKERKISAEDMPKEWVMLREHGEKHIAILDRWQALKALSSNMAAFSLIALFLCILKGGNTGKIDWYWLVPGFFALFLIYTKQANVFRAYLDDDSSALLEFLKLKKDLPQNL